MSAFETLFEENRDFIFRFLLKLCKNSSLAEELTQETFFRAYINLGMLRKPEKAPTWLCQIAKHTYFAWYNEQKKHVPFCAELLQADAPDCAEAFAEKELSERAYQCLQALEEPYKNVFLLAVLADSPLKDISVLYGKSESWARVTFYRAKQKLKESMRKSE